MSKPNISEYHRPPTLQAAWEMVADDDPSVRLLSGGADLTIHAPPQVTILVDVGRLLDATMSTEDDGTVRIGAMTTLTDVMENPDLVDLAGGVIPEMMVHVGNPLLRNFSTIGGHLVRGKLSDVLPVFLALDCEVTIFTGEEATMSLAEYYDESHNSRPHILTQIHLRSLPGRSAAAFLRFARTVYDFPLLNACARVDLEGDHVAQTRLVFGATPQRGQRASQAEQWITDNGLGAGSIETAATLARGEIKTGSSWVASAEYRSHLVEVLTGRCLTEAARRLEMS